MYINLGGDTALNSTEIIGIFDIDNCSAGKDTREFLKAAQRAGRIINTAPDLPRSFVVCPDAVYLTPFAAATLLRRRLR